jgi:hypothetical protein
VLFQPRQEEYFIQNSDHCSATDEFTSEKLIRDPIRTSTLRKATGELVASHWTCGSLLRCQGQKAHAAAVLPSLSAPGTDALDGNRLPTRRRSAEDSFSRIKTIDFPSKNALPRLQPVDSLPQVMKLKLHEASLTSCSVSSGYQLAPHRRGCCQ